MSENETAQTTRTTYSERGYTWPMTIRQRDRILYSTSPDMRAVFYQVELRARAALGADKLFIPSRRRRAK